MRILLLSWNFPPVLGGIEYVVEHLFHTLRAQGHQVQLVTAHADVPPGPDIHRAPRKGLKSFVRFSFTRGFSLCRRFRPDVILCGSLVGAPGAWMLSRIFRIPYAVLVHGSDVLRPGRIYQRAARFLLRRASLLLANSAVTRDILFRQGYDPSRITIIHPGVRVQDFDSPLDRGDDALLRMCAGRRILLSVGRLIRRKGLLEFVEHVMPHLVNDRPDILLLIVGSDATSSLVHAERMRDRIEDAVHRHNLSEQVKLLGNVAQEQLIPLYRRADLFILPALDLPHDVEGFGIVILEAALGQTPAVATRVGGIPEAVVAGQTGILTAPEDYPAMREAILRLLNDDSLRLQLAENAARRAREQFSWESIAARYADALAKLTGSHDSL